MSHHFEGMEKDYYESRTNSIFSSNGQAAGQSLKPNSQLGDVIATLNKQIEFANAIYEKLMNCNDKNFGESLEVRGKVQDPPSRPGTVGEIFDLLARLRDHLDAINAEVLRYQDL